MNFNVVIILAVTSILIFILPKHQVIVPILVTSILVPMGQVIIIGGLDFPIARIVILLGWIRLLITGNFKINGRNGIDTAIILYIISGIITYTLLWQTFSAFINRLGFAFNVIGPYFMCRSYIHDVDDIETVIKTLVFTATILGFFMIFEITTGKNVFTFLGAPDIRMFRTDAFRIFGPFGHPISAGCFGASILPIAYYFFWKTNKKNAIAILGIMSSIAIVVSSHSSTPLLAFIGGVIILPFWKVRSRIHFILYCVYGSLAVLHFIIMKAPVWALIARVSSLAGSHGYHRFLLIDQFIRRFNEWWLFGVKSTAHWSPFESLQLWDVSNQFVRAGVDGGIITFVFFCSMIVISYKKIFKSINNMALSDNDQKLFWVLGCSIFIYILSFLGLSLWDQSYFIWYTLIAMVASASQYIEKIGINSIKEEGLKNEK